MPSLRKPLPFRKLSPRTMRWLMALYPPLLFNRVYAVKVSDDFSFAKVKIKKSFLNKNPNGSIFGGTLACAVDPWYGVLFWQIFARHNIKAKIWVRAAEYDYIKAAETDIYMDFVISKEDIENAIHNLKQNKRFVKEYIVELKNIYNEICCQAKVVMVMHPYVKNS